MEGTLEQDARVFKALCDPRRLAILAQLRGGEKCACVLLEKLDIGQSGLSYHMKVLCESGLVDSRQEGKWTHYRLSGEGQARALELLRRLTTPEARQQETPCH
jgi:ArsR family transcriptional regulator, arsenate/arsenite/antimonite-responsive transcriptional repressor